MEPENDYHEKSIGKDTAPSELSGALSEHDRALDQLSSVIVVLGDKLSPISNMNRVENKAGLAPAPADPSSSSPIVSTISNQTQSLHRMIGQIQTIIRSLEV